MFWLCDAETLPQTGQVKLVWLLYMPLIRSPRFTAIKEGGRNDSSVYLDFGCHRDAFPIPHIPVDSTKGCTRFCESSIHLVIHDNRLREGAARVYELFYHRQLLSDDIYIYIYIYANGTARYTLILVATEMPFRFHTFLLTRPKAALAFASLAFTLSFMTID